MCLWSDYLSFLLSAWVFVFFCNRQSFNFSLSLIQAYISVVLPPLEPLRKGTWTWIMTVHLYLQQWMLTMLLGFTIATKEKREFIPILGRLENLSAPKQWAPTPVWMSLLITNTQKVNSLLQLSSHWWSEVKRILAFIGLSTDLISLLLEQTNCEFSKLQGSLSADHDSMQLLWPLMK